MVVNSSESVAEPNVNSTPSANAAAWRRLTVLAVNAGVFIPTMAPAPLKASVRSAPVKVMLLLIVKVPLAVRVRSRLLTAAPVSMMAAPLNVFAPLLLKLIPIVLPLRVISPPVEMSAKILTTVALLKVRLLVPVKVMLFSTLKASVVVVMARARLLTTTPVSVMAAPLNVFASLLLKLIPVAPFKVILPSVEMPAKILMAPPVLVKVMLPSPRSRPSKSAPMALRTNTLAALVTFKFLSATIIQSSTTCAASVVSASEPMGAAGVPKLNGLAPNAASWRRLTVPAVNISLSAPKLPPLPMAPAPLKVSAPAPMLMSLLIVKVPLAVIVRLAPPVAAPVRVMSPPVSVNAPPRATLLPLNDSALVLVAMMSSLSVKMPVAVRVRS